MPRNGKMFSCLQRHNGLTLVEALIVVIILGVLAAVGIPRIIGPNDSVRVSEGTQILGALLQAQKEYYHENNSTYADNAHYGQLNVSIPTVAASTTTNWLFSVISTGPYAGGGRVIYRYNPFYRLYINAAGTIFCLAGPCAQINCTQGPGANQCN